MGLSRNFKPDPGRRWRSAPFRGGQDRLFRFEPARKGTRHGHRFHHEPVQAPVVFAHRRRTQRAGPPSRGQPVGDGQLPDRSTDQRLRTNGSVGLHTISVDYNGLPVTDTPVVSKISEMKITDQGTNGSDSYMFDSVTFTLSASSPSIPMTLDYEMQRSPSLLSNVAFLVTVQERQRLFVEFVESIVFIEFHIDCSAWMRHGTWPAIGKMFLLSPLFIYVLWRCIKIGIMWAVFNILAYIGGTIAIYILWDLQAWGYFFTRPSYGMVS